MPFATMSAGSVRKSPTPQSTFITFKLHNAFSDGLRTIYINNFQHIKSLKVRRSVDRKS
jgi:hypothetical protein